MEILSRVEDQRDILKEKQPFNYRLIKNDKVQITYNNRLIKTLSGREASKFQSLLRSGSDYDLQLFMAKITGQFKHGNERVI